VIPDFFRMKILRIERTILYIILSCNELEMKIISNHDKVKLVFTAVLMLTVSAGILMLTTPTTVTLSTGTGQSVVAQNRSTDTIQVDAGGDNAMGPLTVYVPQNVTIEAGQSINWINPTTVREPHSVTFVKESNLFPPYIVPFAVPSTAEFRALDPES
jgi:plastocyanin